jgi:thioredoxin reductase (NADPH)
MDLMAEEIYDVIVIGGGPAGTSAAIYTARAGLKTLVLDKGLRTGALGWAEAIANYPGVPGKVAGAELLARMRGQAESFGATYVQERALGADLQDKVKSVWGSEGYYRTKTLVIATGSMGRTNTLPGEERLVGAGVSYCATCDGAFFRDKQVAVAGNGEEAAEEALLLARFASQVQVLVPTAGLNVPPELEAQLQEQPKVTVHLATRVREILGEEQVVAVRVSEPGGAERELPVDGIFLYLQGRQPITGFLEGQVDTTESGCLVVDGSQQTHVPGVFAVGDVLCTHLRQAVVAAAEGAIAGMSIERYLSGREQLRPDWS